MIPAASYDPDTLGLLGRALNEAWADTLVMFGARLTDGDSLRTSMAKRILAAAQNGERDVARLKRFALSEIDA
jgi:hypothetical protein